MPTTIFIALLATGTLSAAVFFWYLFKYVESYFGEKERHIAARISYLGAQTIDIKTRNASYQDADAWVILSNHLNNTLFMQWLSFQIVKAGLSISTIYVATTSLAIFVLSFVIVLYMTSLWLFSLLIGVFLGCCPFVVLKYLAYRRQVQLEKELPDLLDFMARSLQVGHSLNKTFQMAADEAPQPISGEIRKVFEELNYGAPIQKVLSELTRRVESPEVRYFVTAVIVNREIGGDLAEILKRVSKLVRDRIDMRRTIQVITAEGRSSALVLGALPFVIGSLIYFINPESYNLMMREQLGRDLLLYAGLLMLLGFIWMHRLCALKE